MPTDNQSTIVYEYPLQERVRTYLRLESCLQQLAHALHVTQNNIDGFFPSLFAAQELIERSDVRGELIKDLDQQRQYMQQWQDHPKIDQNALQGALQSIEHASQNLQQSTRELRPLKEDKFLSSIRQRFAQPGISGLFELPQLQLWLAQPAVEREQHIDHWYQQLQPLAAAIDLTLALIRQQGSFEQVTAQNGFWQESCDPLALLRIEIPADYQCYPVVSGHRQRFTLRFMALPRGTGSGSDGLAEDIRFGLARCAFSSP